MGLQDTPASERIHIGFFGMRNVGKSSLMNALTSQEVSLVSEIKGTTTDPVKKAMELLPLGPVLLIDTPGLDDMGELGIKRRDRALRILSDVDIAILVIDVVKGMGQEDKELISAFKEKRIPYILAWNKIDLLKDINININTNTNIDTNSISMPDNVPEHASIPAFASNHSSVVSPAGEQTIYLSAREGMNIPELKEMLGGFAALLKKRNKPIISDLISPGDTVLLVMPIDEASPKGRLILPQQLVSRDILDSHAILYGCQPEELKPLLGKLREKPSLVISDARVFKEVAEILPEDVELTAFSIIMARYKGSLQSLIKGASTLSELREGDKVLIAEACTHRRQCGDIGSVRLPAWIDEYSGHHPDYYFTSGNDFPKDLSPYRLIVHCGGCMVNEKEMKLRQQEALTQGVPMVNYGMAIAAMHGLLKRALRPFVALSPVRY